MVDENKTEKKPAAKSVAGKSPTKKKSKESGKVVTPKAASAATAKAAASKESDMKSAAKKINAVDKENANNAIKSKKSSDDLKSRAAEAKQRAQQKILDNAYVSDKPVDPLERLANTFDSSARRWEMVVYPSLFAFVLLAGYGFFLIYRLTHDIATLSQSVTHMAVIVSDSMPRMTKDLNVMTHSINSMTGNISNMSGDIGGMSHEISSMSGQMNSLTPMSKNIQSMTHNIGSMNRSVYGMQRDMHGMNRTVSSGPFGMMNDMMPFGSNSNVPPALAPTPVWPSYNSVPQRNYVLRQPVTTNKNTKKFAATPTQQAKAKPVTIKPVTTKPVLSKPVTIKPVAVKPAEVTTKVTMPGASPVVLKKTPANNSSFDEKYFNHKWNNK